MLAAIDFVLCSRADLPGSRFTGFFDDGIDGFMGDYLFEVWWV